MLKKIFRDAEIFTRPQSKPVTKYLSYIGIRNTALYFHGDSCARHLNDSAFTGLSGSHHIRRPQKYAYRPDTAKK